MDLGGRRREGDGSVSRSSDEDDGHRNGGAVLDGDRAVVRPIADLVDYDNREDYQVRPTTAERAGAALGRVQLARCRISSSGGADRRILL